jgi:hyperosmotically inducible protein
MLATAQTATSKKEQPQNQGVGSTTPDAQQSQSGASTGTGASSGAQSGASSGTTPASGAQSGATGSAAQSTPQADRGSQKGEERLYKEVRHELVMLPNLSLWDNLAYKVEGYKVTLLGQVRNAGLKSEAENSVKHIEGVEQVDNQIQVLPPSPADDRIRVAVARSIFDAPGLFPYAMESVPPIHIIVQGGNVTLEGVVNNEGDKNMAEMRAKQIPGVFSVTNHLQVVPNK